jgi:hypothetical protein
MRTLAPALLLMLCLCGCNLSYTAPSSGGPGAVLQGHVHGGQQPVAGAHVYLFAAGTSAYGAASTSLLNALSTGNSDSTGAYVLTDSNGAFTITGDYTCTSGDQVYVLALGGDPGAGVNSGVGLMAALGSCPGTSSFPSSTFISVNEVSTIAAAYAIAPFAVDPTHVSSSGTTQAKLGIGNAFANAANLVNLASGAALTTTPAGNGTVPQTRINTLGNILAACINSTGPTSSACSTLFASTLSGGTTGTAPTDTATAAINLAHYPYLNMATLCGLQTGTPPFLPDLACTGPNYPTDFAISLSFGGGGITSGNPLALAIDASGNVWAPTYQTGLLTEFSPLGAALSGTGFTGAGILGGLDGIAIDNSGNVWVVGVNSGLSKFSSTGSPASANAFGGGGMSGPDALAVDSGGSIWVANNVQFSPVVSRFNSNGTVYTGAPYSGNGIIDSTAMAIDPSGNVWIANSSAFGRELTKMPNSGGPLSATVSYNGGGISTATTSIGVAIDASGNVWSTGNNLVAEISSSGTAISPSSGYTGGISVPQGIAIDGLGNAWVIDRYIGLSVFTNSGVALSPSTSILGSAPLGGSYALAIDPSGNIWVANSASGTAPMTEFIGLAAPVVTPTVSAVINSKLGTRP